MTVSFSEHAALICPNCRANFSAEIWLILDAQEQPDQVAALRQERLNLVTCPHCGYTGPAGAPLLFHDGAARCVIFAAAPGAAEHEWRDQARDLHALLVGSIPVDQRRAYLGDVQIAQDLSGIAHILGKAGRRQGDARARERAAPRMPADTAQPVSPARVAPQPADVEPARELQEADMAVLFAAVQALMSVETPESLRSVVDTYPILLRPGTDAALAQLAEVAVAQREYEIADSLHRARMLLLDMRAGKPVDAGNHAQHEAAARSPADALGDEPQVSTTLSPQAELPEAAYQAVLQAHSADALLRVVAEYPLLLEPWVDAALAYQVDQALDQDLERLAQQLEERRERLAELRQDLQGVQREAPESWSGTPPSDEAPRSTLHVHIQAAIQALLTAEDEDMMAQVLVEYPVLFSDDAQQALWECSSAARARGDEALAIYAVECRALLQKVREGLEG